MNIPVEGGIMGVLVTMVLGLAGYIRYLHSSLMADKDRQIKEWREIALKGLNVSETLAEPVVKAAKDNRK